MLTFIECQKLINSKTLGKGTLWKTRLVLLKKLIPPGRIVIPKEFRDRLFLDKKVEVVLTEEGVLIRNSEYQLVKTEKTDSD